MIRPEVVPHAGVGWWLRMVLRHLVVRLVMELLLLLLLLLLQKLHLLYLPQSLKLLEALVLLDQVFTKLLLMM